MVYSSRRFVLCLALCYLVLVFFSPFSIAITSLGEERASLGAFRTFVRDALVWFCLSPLPLGVWVGLWFLILALPGLFSYPLFFLTWTHNKGCYYQKKSWTIKFMSLGCCLSVKSWFSLKLFLVVEKKNLKCILSHIVFSGHHGCRTVII